jgi:hypothetical protein
MKIIPGIIALVLPVFLVSSCKYLSFIKDDEKVAQLHGKTIYKSEIKALIPAGTVGPDSLAMLKQYINSWAVKNLIADKAEKELSKDEKDVRKEIEEYRNSLLVFRYEQKYIQNNLDTNITDEECKEYYKNNSSNFTRTSSVVKARIIKISKNSPNNTLIKKLYDSPYTEDVEELQRISYNSADRYNNFNNEWTDMENVAREVPLDLQTCEKAAWSKSCIETSDSLYNYYVYFAQKIAPDAPAPFEYHKPKIKEIILSKRKQALLAKLEEDLIKDALKHNDLKINFNLSKDEK